MADDVYISKEDFEKLTRKEIELEGFEVVDHTEIENTEPGVDYYRLILKRKSDGRLFGSEYWNGGVLTDEGVRFIFQLDAKKNSEGLYRLHEYSSEVVTEVRYTIIKY